MDLPCRPHLLISPLATVTMIRPLVVGWQRLCVMLLLLNSDCHVQEALCWQVYPAVIMVLGQYVHSPTKYNSEIKLELYHEYVHKRNDILQV